MKTVNRYRTIWISDLHLGTRECKAAFLLDFLRHHDADTIYLVGDIVDGWALARSWYWDQHHNDVIQKLLRKARKGTQIIYIPGNHDEFARDYLGLRFGRVCIKPSAVHTTADGRQLLVLHGDEFDGVICHARWLSVLGARAYILSLKLNRWLNHLRRWRGRPYWSLAAYLKRRAKLAVQFIADFEAAVVREAHAHDVDGIVCGHIHFAEMRTVHDRLYINTGDWVESCTALVEYHDGRLELLRWIPLDHASMKASGDGQAEASLPALRANGSSGSGRPHTQAETLITLRSLLP